jgi:hypothetical protein
MMNEVEITPQTKRKSVWIIRLLGLFLLLTQSAGLIFGGAYYFKKKAEENKSDALQSQSKTDSSSQQQNNNSQTNGIDDLLKSGAEIKKIATETDVGRYKSLFNPIGALIALSAIAYFFRFRSGWLVALLLEGVVLYVCLSLYFGNQFIPLIYPIMLYGIFMVLFLNSGAVRKAFLPRLLRKDEG